MRPFIALALLPVSLLGETFDDCYLKQIDHEGCQAIKK